MPQILDLDWVIVFNASTQLAWSMVLWLCLKRLCFSRTAWPIVLGALLVVPHVWARDMLARGSDWFLWQAVASDAWLFVIRGCYLAGGAMWLREIHFRYSVLKVNCNPCAARPRAKSSSSSGGVRHGTLA